MSDKMKEAYKEYLESLSKIRPNIYRGVSHDTGFRSEDFKLVAGRPSVHNVNMYSGQAEWVHNFIHMDFAKGTDFHKEIVIDTEAKSVEELNKQPKIKISPYKGRRGSRMLTSILIRQMMS